MGGCRCSYRNCANTTKTRENLHFFHYPVKQKDRCKKWIENAHKTQFYNLDEDQLRNKVICETHFEDFYFPNFQKKRLLQGAIPTLDGDCEEEITLDEDHIKIQDVQVLPANDDGTIFVLETNNMGNNFASEQVESYIYTNNGLVLPIDKCDEVENIQEIFENPEEQSEDISKEQPMAQEVIENFNQNEDYQQFSVRFGENVNDQYIEMVDSKPLDIMNVNNVQNNESITNFVEDKYVKKIKQHSKDIALLKRMLKSKTVFKKPSNITILNSLRRQVSDSLFGVINFNLNGGKCAFSPEQLEFFSTIYSTSPQVYEILSKKYKWKLPNPLHLNSTTSNKNNGHVIH